MRFYVTADPHGHCRELVRAMRQAGYFEDTGEKRLVVCGDLLDRGEEACRTVELMLDLQAKGELILVRGNHEDLFEDALSTIEEVGAYGIACGASHHYRNGTWHTLLQLSGMDPGDGVRYARRLCGAVRQSPFYRRLLPAAVDYFETADHIFTHGWIPPLIGGTRLFARYHYDPDWRSATPETWRRARWYNGMDMACRSGVREPGKTVVCGHWRAAYGHAAFEGGPDDHSPKADFTPFSAEGILALDACTVVSGFVNCAVIEDDLL